MSRETIAIMSPGDMGHAVGRALGEHGHRVITCLDGRSTRSRDLAAAGGLEDVGSLDSLVGEADLLLSIMPPSAALDFAGSAAAAMRTTGKAPAYADCNAVSPDTACAIEARISAAGATFIDVGIIGLAPGTGPGPRFYASGPDAGRLMVLDGKGVSVRPMGGETGRASAIKMCYAALTKGTFTLGTAVLIVGEILGVGLELREELESSQSSAYAAMNARVPFLAADAERWSGEMDEIAATFASAGVTTGFHRAAGEVFRLLASTPLAAETRETLDRTRTLEEALAVYVGAVRRPGVGDGD